MTWFKVDDTAHTHPKLRGAGMAAIGLWTVGGAYAAQHLTDGIVHAHFVKTNATAPQVAKLVNAGLWHAAGHDCSRCPQPSDGDYVMHDYLVYNPSRARVLAERKRAADKKRNHRSGTAKGARTPPDREEFADGPAPNPSRLRDASEGKTGPNRDRIPDETAGHGPMSPGESDRPHAHATQPSPPSLPAEEREKQASCDRPPPQPGDRPQIPGTCRPLVDALTAARLFVGWDLKPAEWFLTEALIARCGITALVASATASWQGARRQPRSGRYFLPAWRALPDAPTHLNERLPAAAGAEVIPFHTRPPAPATHNSSVLARARARLQDHHRDT